MSNKSNKAHIKQHKATQKDKQSDTPSLKNIKEAHKICKYIISSLSVLLFYVSWVHGDICFVVFVVRVDTTVLSAYFFYCFLGGGVSYVWLRIAFLWRLWRRWISRSHIFNASRTTYFRATRKYEICYVAFLCNSGCLKINPENRPFVRLMNISILGVSA